MPQAIKQKIKLRILPPSALYLFFLIFLLVGIFFNFFFVLFRAAKIAGDKKVAFIFDRKKELKFLAVCYDANKT